MKCNLAPWDRSLRFILGILGLAYAIAGGPAWMYLSIYFILTAAWGFCTVYAFLRIQTLSEKTREFFKK
ncbi:MAG: DUF2892 domain-containing protein [Bdellovibrionales bacterium]|nr:DUF2892 domain-containing protein [Bdellovibrionales bacterium]